jgi:signal transduction histidine kinase/DNA-binding response OmpR family regulator
MSGSDWLILNVDDRQPIRYAKTRALQRAGFNVMEATTGQQALACVENYRPALVVLDVKLPDMSGLDVSAAIKKDFPGTLVLQVSASFVTTLDRVAGLERGADSYLTEPVEPEELVASVRALLRLKQYEVELRAANSRREFIFTLAERQRQLITPDAIMQMTSELLGQKLLAYRTGFYRVTDPDLLEFLSCWSSGQLPRLSGLASAAETLGDALIEQYRQGRSLVTPHATHPMPKNEGLDYSAVGAPILRADFWEATLFVSAAPGRSWYPDEVALVEEVAQLTWDAVERARAIQTLRNVSENLEERIASRSRELLRAEEQLRQAQKMEAVGQLTGGIAHDFNNLLTGIIGGINVVRNRIAKGQMNDVTRFMDEVVNSAHRAASLTHRLLAFSRRQALDFSATDVNKMVQSLLELFRRTVGENIEMELQAGADLWPARTDANQLETALLNLIINARDAMPTGGRVVISTENFAVKKGDAQIDLLPGDYVVLRVVDTGAGMPKDVIDRVFDPFFTTKPVGQGTGLGLSMVYGFAKQSGGAVEIESEERKGTAVSIFIPRAAQAAETRATAQSRDNLKSATGETVMLVEDSPSVRMVVADLLKELGYQVVVCSEGQEAADFFSVNERAINLLISDVGLPGLNGRQVAEIGLQKWPAMKVLFITGYAEAAVHRAEFLPSGAQLIAKPFELDALARKITEMLAADRESASA